MTFFYVYFDDLMTNSNHSISLLPISFKKSVVTKNYDNIITETKR